MELAFLKSIFLCEFIKHFDKNEIPYRKSDFYHGVFDASLNQPFGFLPFHSVSIWLSDIEKKYSLAPLAFNVGQEMKLDFLPQEIRSEIQKEPSPYLGLTKLIAFMTQNNRDIEIQIDASAEDVLTISVCRSFLRRHLTTD